MNIIFDGPIPQGYYDAINNSWRSKNIRPEVIELDESEVIIHDDEADGDSPISDGIGQR